ncbi:MAG: hypothetical protein GTN93_21465 [Anaerolineae bacterium]|nr:hypothetical protein [Anaerolineae bacterium]
MSNILKAEDASVKTVEISVKVIRIGKRQMTQAVFKQLTTINEYEMYTLWKDTQAKFWGWINYYAGPVDRLCRPFTHSWKENEPKQATVCSHDWGLMRESAIGMHHNIVVQLGDQLVRSMYYEEVPIGIEPEDWIAFKCDMEDLEQLFIAV